MYKRQALTDAFGRIDVVVTAVLEGLDLDKVNWRPGGAGNSIAWLIWHLARIQDEQIAAVAGTGSVWQAGSYAERFAFPLDAGDTGYGHSARQVDAVQVTELGLLGEYHHAVLQQSLRYLRDLDNAQLNQVIDEQGEPPVTLGVRLISIVDDCLQHGGQAAYVKGLAVELWPH